MTQRHQIRGALGGHHPGEPRRGEHVALLDLARRGCAPAWRAASAAAPSHRDALGLLLAADVDHLHRFPPYAPSTARPEEGPRRCRRDPPAPPRRGSGSRRSRPPRARRAVKRRALALRRVHHQRATHPPATEPAAPAAPPPGSRSPARGPRLRSRRPACRRAAALEHPPRHRVVWMRAARGRRTLEHAEPREPPQPPRARVSHVGLHPQRQRAQRRAASATPRRARAHRPSSARRAASAVDARSRAPLTVPPIASLWPLIHLVVDWMA